MRLEAIAEQIIQEAIGAGFFDNLAGAGMPIEWKSNPFAPEEWRMAFEILEKNGYRLVWMDKRIEIEDQYTKAVHDLKNNLFVQNPNSRAQFFQEVERINRAIIDYNLMVPLVQFQRSAYDARKTFLEIQSKNGK